MSKKFQPLSLPIAISIIFGGALGVLSSEEINARKTPIIAPKGFMEEATSENVMAGSAMIRRATYMYGTFYQKCGRIGGYRFR